MTDVNRISRTETLWSVVLRAHGDDSVERQSAQRDLIDRYGFAIRRYLQAALRDEMAVDEVFQEFSLAFVRGDYAGVSPDRGRFRGFLKTVLFRLVADHRRRQYRRRPAAGIVEQTATAAVEDDSSKTDEQFGALWRESLLGRTWAKLETYEHESGKPAFTVLRLRADQPQLDSKTLAEVLSTQLEKPITPANARVLIHRAREKFANLLLDEIVPSLDNPTYDRIEEELIDIGLINYCRETLEERFRDAVE